MIDIIVTVGSQGYHGFRAIGQFFPNGETRLSVTAEELAELEAEREKLSREPSLAGLLSVRRVPAGEAA